MRSVIRFSWCKGTTPIEIHRELISVYGEKCMDVKNVRKWCREFQEGRTNVHDEAGRGRPSVSDETVNKVEELLLADRRLTVREISELLGDVSKTTVDKILTEILLYHKVCARWVPRMFSEQHKTKRLDYGWEIIDHLPYSPDLAPSDYHLFPNLKNYLGGRKFLNDEELKTAVDFFLRKSAGEWYEEGIKKLSERLQKCIDRNGDYVEK